MAEFVLDVHEISEAGKAYDFAIPRPWLVDVLQGTGLVAAPGAEDGRVTLRAHKQGQDVVIQGRVTSSLLTECARCLEDAIVDVDADITTLLTARGPELRPSPDAIELTPEDLERDFYSGDKIVLDDNVREHILLEVPYKPLCREECEGIKVPSSISGPADLNRVQGAGAPTEGVDPRLAPLLSLVGKVPTEE